MYLYSSYRSAPSLLGAAPLENIVVDKGVQKTRAGTGTMISGFLSQLFPVPLEPDPAIGPVAGSRFVAMPCSQAQANGATCDTNALQGIETAGPGVTAIVNVTSANIGQVDYYIVSSQEAIQQVAAPGSDYAVLDTSTPQEKPEKKKTEPITIAIGAGAGGALGFATAGPGGGLAGAVAGGLLANWLA